MQITVHNLSAKSFEGKQFCCRCIKPTSFRTTYHSRSQLKVIEPGYAKPITKSNIIPFIKFFLRDKTKKYQADKLLYTA